MCFQHVKANQQASEQGAGQCFSVTVCAGDCRFHNRGAKLMPTSWCQSQQQAVWHHPNNPAMPSLLVLINTLPIRVLICWCQSLQQAVQQHYIYYMLQVVINVLPTSRCLPAGVKASSRHFSNTLHVMYCRFSSMCCQQGGAYQLVSKPAAALQQPCLCRGRFQTCLDCN